MKILSFLTVALSALIMLSGCISYQYEGSREKPVKKADEIRIFNNATLIPRRYSILGTATVSAYTQDVSRDRMIDKLRSEARECGASAILIVEQQLVTVNSDSGAQPFTTAFDYDDTNQNWSQIYRDVDQNFANTRRTRNSHVTPGASKRIIRAEFIRYK